MKIRSPACEVPSGLETLGSGALGGSGSVFLGTVGSGDGLDSAGAAGAEGL